MYYIISGLLNFLTSFSIGTLVFIKNRESAVNKSFVLFTATVSMWALGYTFWQLSQSYEQSLFWIRFAMIGSIAISPAFTDFIIHFVNAADRLRLFRLINWTIGLVIILFSYSELFIQTVTPMYVFKFWPVPGFLFYIFHIFFVINALSCWWLVFNKLKTSSGISKVREGYILIASCIGFIGGMTNHLLWYKIPIPPLGNIGVAIGVIMTAYAIARHRLMDIEVVIKKTVIFTGLFAFIFGIIAAVSFILQNLFAKFVQINNWLSLAISAVILLFLYDAAKRFLVNATDKFLFQREYDHQQILKEISRGMIGKVELEELRDFISSALLEKMKLEDANIIGKDGPRQLKVAISIPIFLRDEEYWVLMLGDKKSGKLYTKEDINMLEALSHEIAIAVENAINFQDLKQSQLELLRQENLKFVSVLVKGLAHEIFNPLTPLMHSIEELEGEDLIKLYEVYENNKTKFDKDDELKFKESILALRNSTKSLKNNAQHIHLIVDTLNKIEKGDDKTIGPVDLKTFFKEVITVLGFEVDPNIQRGVIVNQDIGKDLSPVKGNPTLLKQVFINLYKNACEAMKNSLSKTVDISCIVNKLNSNELLIKFSDTGPGIPTEILSRLFTHGFTTKGAKGSGIGLSQCKAMIEKFGGTITVKSEIGKGATFTITLPIWKEETVNADKDINRR